MANKLYFAPLPPRAIGDSRLTTLHFRVLACVALHDRMAGAIKRGQGCWAGPKGIATKCEANVTNVSTAINDLLRWEYLESRYHPEDKRKRVLHVLYTDDDTAVVVRADSLPTGKQPHADRLPSNGKIVCPAPKN
jgi:DNA-binding MarR family transcriptional regulator